LVWSLIQQQWAGVRGKTTFELHRYRLEYRETGGDARVRGNTTFELHRYGKEEEVDSSPPNDPPEGRRISYTEIEMLTHAWEHLNF
jgi:hypothetical protein